MQCIHPVWLPKKQIYVRCNNCRACRIARATDWTLRLMHELYYWEHAVFLTLTYDDDNLPERGSLVKTDLQKFIKRLRRDYEPNRLRYYGVGEYGENTNRPHYHIIIYGCAVDDNVLNSNYVTSGPLKDNWPYGYVYAGTVTYDSCRYVSDYIQKNMEVKKQKNYMKIKESNHPLILCQKA